jgi:hypothetical protein
MKTFKVVLTVILAIVGVVCFCSEHPILGAIILGIAVAVWMPKNGGNKNGKNNGSWSDYTLNTWWWLNNN